MRHDFEQAGLGDIWCYGLGIRAAIVGRPAATADMQLYEEATMQIKRRSSGIQSLADVGLHMLSIGTKLLIGDDLQAALSDMRPQLRK